MNHVEMQDGYLVRFCGMGNVMGGGKGTDHESLIGVRRFASSLFVQLVFYSAVKLRSEEHTSELQSPC